VNLANFNNDLFTIASKLDKCLMLVVSCGFNLNSLIQDPSEENQFIQTAVQLIIKLTFYVNCIEKVSEMSPTTETQELRKILLSQVKMFIKYLSELQYNENLLMFNSLDEFILVLSRILYQSQLYPSKICKMSLFALYRVVNTSIYN
jgi:hypothetical protein